MDAEWVEVRSCTWMHEAHLVKSVLESAGIEVRIPNEHTLGVQPGFAPLLGGVRVLVPAEDRDAAEAVLAAAADGPADEET